MLYVKDKSGNVHRVLEYHYNNGIEKVLCDCGELLLNVHCEWTTPKASKEEYSKAELCFESFWKALNPLHKRGKTEAKKKYIHALLYKRNKKTDVEKAAMFIQNSWKQYMIELEIKRKVEGWSPVAKNVSTWINKEGYKDEYIKSEQEYINLKSKTVMKTGNSNILKTQREIDAENNR